MTAKLETPMSSGRRGNIVRWLGQGAAVVTGLVVGYDIGLRMSGGQLMGVVMAVNTAFFFAVATSAAVEQVLRMVEHQETDSTRGP